MNNATTSNDTCRDEKSRSTKEEMYSYTNTGCFYCHKEPIKGTGDNHQEMTTVNIENILPYLNLNIKSSHENDYEDNECEFSVILCVHCSSVSMKLKESIWQMEMAKMQVNLQLRELQQVLNEYSKKEGEKDSIHNSRGKALQVSRFAAVTTENISNQKEVQLLGVIKPRTADCETPVVPDLIGNDSDFPLARKSVPNFSGSDVDVNIETGKALQVSSNAAVTAENISYQTEVQFLGVMKQKTAEHPFVVDLTEPKNPQNLSSPDADGVTEAENTKITKCDTPTDWTAELMRQSEIRFQHKKRIDSFYCPFCEDCDKYKRGSTSNLRGHLMATHPVEFFIAKLSPTLSEDIIRNHFKRILSQQVSEMKLENGQPKSTTKNPDVLCHICDRTCTSVTSSKNHFIRFHYTILEEKLMNLKSMEITGMHQAAQEYDPSKSFLISMSPALQEILSNLCREKPGSGSSNFRRCGICKNGKYRDKSTIFRHLLGPHIDKVFASKRLPDISQMDFKNCCAQVLAAVFKLNNEDFVCSICEFKHHDRYQIRNHLASEHSDILEERLIRFQEEALSSGYIKPSVMPKPRRKRKSMKKAGGIYISQDGKDVPVPAQTEPVNIIIDKNPVKSELVELIFENFSMQFGMGVMGEDTPSDGYRCRICKSSTSFRTLYCKAEIERHLVYDHPDLFFPGKKLPEISGDKFQVYCKTVAMDRSNYVVQYKNGVMCSFCEWKCRDSRTVRRHIMLMHHNVLEYKLDCLQGKKGRTSEMGSDTGPNKVKKIKLNPATSMRSEVDSGSGLGSAAEMGRNAIEEGIMGAEDFVVSKDEGQAGNIDFCDPPVQLGPSYSSGNVSHYIGESYEIEEETNEPDGSSYQDTNDCEMKPDPNCCEVVINEEDGSVGVGNEMKDSTSMMYFEEEEPIVKMENDYDNYDNSAVVKTEVESILPDF